jgi:hypothetical protein
MQLPDEAVKLLDAQHGVVLRCQLLTIVENANVVDGWLRRGLFSRDHRGVLRLRGAPRTPQQQLMSAVLRGGEGARADGRASCWLLGLEGFGPSVGIVVPFPRQVGGVSFESHTTTLEPADFSTVDGIACLSAARALIEVAPHISEKALRVAFDSARRSGLLTVAWLERRAIALGTHYGARLVLKMIGTKVLEQESEGERVLSKLLTGVDGLEWGVSDLVPGRRLDCLDRDALLVIEYDGRDHHVLPTDRDADGLRDIEVRSVKVDGIPLDIVRITGGMIKEHPQRVRDFIERRRDERRREIAALRATGLLAPTTATP